jgi:hypothetical protein
MYNAVYHIHMKGFLSHLSAAKAWQIPYIEAVLGDEITDNAPNEITVFEQDQR